MPLLAFQVMLFYTNTTNITAANTRLGCCYGVISVAQKQFMVDTANQEHLEHLEERVGRVTAPSLDSFYCYLSLLLHCN